MRPGFYFDGAILNKAPASMMNSRTSQRRSEASMEEYIHRQNLALLKKRLAEPHSDTMHC